MSNNSKNQHKKANTGTNYRIKKVKTQNNASKRTIMKNRLQIKSKRKDKLRNDHQNKAKSRKTKTKTNKTQNYHGGKLKKQHQKQ